MTILPYTTTALAKRGFPTESFNKAANRCFTHASTASTGTVQAFWNEFVKARRLLFGGDTKKEAA